MVGKTIVPCVFFLLLILFVESSSAAYNVINYGAKGDGKTDSTEAFLDAWKVACSSTRAATIYVPKGRYLIKEVKFSGPCKNRITVWIAGSIIAPEDYKALGNSGSWILFIEVDNLIVVGGILDAKGAGFWACSNHGSSCPGGARSMAFKRSNNVIISGLTSINSQRAHLDLHGCNNVVVRNVKFYAPAESPNTDGIHVQSSDGVTISGSTLQTGDDCVSIGSGTKNLFMKTIKCGPGHGISIGSLAQDLNEEGVENITLTDAVFIGSDNGVRIKSWARRSTGFVRNVLFQNLIMFNVKNPIVIDQNYCPYNKECPTETSGVKISDVTYRNIQGTSATPVAVAFDCSPSNPCTGIRMENINLTYLNETATATCKYIYGKSRGVPGPQSCL